MDQWEELHFFRPNDLVDYVWVVSIAHVHKVLVRSNERLLTQLSLQVDPESLYSVAHRVRGLHARQILQELGRDPHLWWLGSVVLLRVLVALAVVICHALIVAQSTPGLRLVSVAVAANTAELAVLSLSGTGAAVDCLLGALARLDHAATVGVVALGRQGHYLALQVLIVVLLRFLVGSCAATAARRKIVLSLLEIVPMLHSREIVGRSLLLRGLSRVRLVVLWLLILPEGRLCHELAALLILILCKLLTLPRYALQLLLGL